MSVITVKCGKIEISNKNNFCLIAGPCQLENQQHAIDMSGKIKEITKPLSTRQIEPVLKEREELDLKNL